MLFNKSQRIITIFYCFLLIAIFTVFTPHYNFHINDFYRLGDDKLRHEAINDTSKEFYGNFFLLNTNQIVFKKLLFEICLLSIIYILLLFTLKSKTRDTHHS